MFFVAVVRIILYSVLNYTWPWMTHFPLFKDSIFSVVLVLNLTKTEDGGEESVADLEGEGDCPALVVVLDPHRHHVQEDEDKDGDLKAAGE